MTIKKYSGDKVIREKIKELFDDRKLTALLQKSGLDKNKSFIAHLTDIQFQIYLLDAYLESRWELDKDELNARWKGITLALGKQNYSEKQIEKLLREIKTYERIEKNCRKNKWPTRLSFRKFYTTKSCDVRLIRHLIYDAHPQLRQTWKEAAWKYYDRIAEIHDDISDLKEDLQTYNGNRFLISILRQGSEKTLNEYRSYLLGITSKAKLYCEDHHHTPDSRQLLVWIKTHSKETLRLLEQTIKTTDPELYTSSLLLQHME